MNCHSTVRIVFLVLLTHALTIQAGVPQWETLFDGGDLEAFEVVMKEGAAQQGFAVVDGVIQTYPDLGEGEEAVNGMLRTKKRYGNFHLRWEYRYDGRQFRENRNSGVLYYAQGDDVWPRCMEFQLMENKGGWPVTLYAQARLRVKDDKYDPKGEFQEMGVPDSYAVTPGAVTADRPIGEWNQAELLVKWDRAYHLLNGQVIARVDRIKVANAEKTDWINPRNGQVAFQCEGAGIAFRNIEIQENPLGYIDTPLIPGQPWRVHDSARPQPPMAVLTPYDATPATPPADAVVLLGKDTCQFTNKDWKVEDGVMTVHRVGKKHPPQKSTVAFGDGHYHIEWTAPTEIKGTSQGRGNSGVYLMTHYEVQVLDCWDNATYPDGMVGSIYGQMPPLYNAVRKPGEWNHYDIFFKAPVFDGDTLVTPAYVTVMLNGVILQNNQEILGAGTHRKNATYKAHADKLPLSLQDHGNPVRFRNIWVCPLDRDVTQR